LQKLVGNLFGVEIEKYEEQSLAGYGAPIDKLSENMQNEQGTLIQLRQTYLKNKRKPVNFMHIIDVTPLIT